MTSNQATSLAALGGALLLLFLLVIIGIPYLARLEFIRRLESIRDECFDAILQDRLHEGQSVELFLRGVETSAAASRLLTVPRLLAFARALIDVGIDPQELVLLPGYPDLPAGERHIMGELEARLCEAYRCYLNWGSTTSWIRRPYLWLISCLRPASAIARAREVLPAVARETLQHTAKPTRNPPPGHLFASR
jgi:hypothetical protein